MPIRHQVVRRPRLPALLSLLAASAVFATFALPASAQDVPPELVEQALRRSGLTQQELMQRLQAQGTTVVDTTLPPGRTALPPGPRVILPFDLETAAVPAAVAAETPLPTADTPFGADFFRLDPGMFAPPAFGPVPPDYMLGPGDQVSVDVFGEVEFRLERVVDRDGGIILPKGGKVNCAGRTLAQVTRAVREKLAGSYSGIDPSGEGGSTFVDVSLGALRAIRVFVVGEARQPGAYELTSLSTAFTALYAAGGPNEQGGLRSIKVLRGNQLLAELDFYGYLLEGRRGDDPILRDGDTVLIPARTITVRVEGEVRRPRTYELKDGEDVQDLIRFAGGFTAEAVADVVHVARIVPLPERRPEQPDRVQSDLDLRLKMRHLLRDADVVRVDRIPERLENWVEAQGNVKNTGRYEFREGMTVVDLVRQAGGLWADTLPERALIERLDPDLTYRTIEVALAEAMSGALPPLPLQSRDKLRV
ncbi:MAG: SLBB domain-containing protein, partial [bacterium]|nr:SLBB domain-containing protein [bacterium]